MVFSVVVCLCSVLTSCVGESIVGSVTSTYSSVWGSYAGVPVPASTKSLSAETGVVIVITMPQIHVGWYFGLERKITLYGA